MKAQGLPISTIIIAILGIIILLVLIFAIGKQVGLFGKQATDINKLKPCTGTNIDQVKPFYECKKPLLEYGDASGNELPSGYVCCGTET